MGIQDRLCNVSFVGSCRAFVCLIAVASAVPAISLPPGPQIPAPNFDVIEKCLSAPQDQDSHAINHEWKLVCDLEEFLNFIREDSRNWPTHVALLSAHVLYKEFLRFRAKIQVNIKKDENLKRPEGFFWTPSTETKAEEELGPNASSVNAFVNATSVWVDDMDLLLRPLFDEDASTKKYGSGKTLLLKKEAALLWFRFLNTAKRFALAKVGLDTKIDFLLFNRYDRAKVLSIIIDVVKKDPVALEQYRDLLITNLEKIPAKEDHRITAGDFDQWLFLWRLKGQNMDSELRSQLQKSLRRMWILFPLKQDKVKIRKLAIELGVSRSFIGPSIRQMSLDELLTYAKKQVNFLEGDSALVTMAQVLRLPTKLVEADELWDALEFHLRLLRIMDQRHKIPAILKRYLQKGHFIDIPQKVEAREKFFDHMYQVGKWRWSYDTQNEAVKVFDQIIALNRAWGTDFKLAASFYVRARIAEQSGDKNIARSFFDQAIQELEPQKRAFMDLYLDLRWRRFFNSLDLAVGTNDYKDISKELDGFKSDLNWKEEGSRWLFWKANALLLEGQKSEAKEFFEKAYENEPLGYFSALSGLELVKLGDEPSGWKMGGANKFWSGEQEVWQMPSFSEIFSTKTLKTEKSQDEAWARIYGLASIRRFKDLKRYLPSLERRAYVYAMGSKRKYKTRDKRRLLQKIAWLRLAVGDHIGALRTGELARIVFEGDIGAEELAYLYPLPYKDLIHAESIKNKIDPWHVTSLIRQESAFNSQARSSANALGLMQIIPPVAEAEARELKIEGFEPEMLLKPEIAVKMGTFHLSKLFYLFESSIIVSTAGYNAGRPPAYDWLEHYFNPLSYAFIDRISFTETRGYVRSILRNYVNYSRIYNDAEIDPIKLLKMPILMPKTRD